MAPPRTPDQIKIGSLRLPLYKLGDGRLAFDYKDGSKRKVVKRSNLEDLRAEAERIGLAILNAETAALELSAEQRRIATAAFASLDPLGLHLDTTAREVAEAHALTGGASIIAMARYYAQRNPSRLVAPPTGQIAAELIHELKHAKRQRSPQYLDQLRRDLEAFGKLHPDLTAVGEKDLLAYLGALRSKPGRDGRSQPVGPRRRDNVRDAIVRLSRFSREKGYLPEETKSAAERIERISEGHEVTTFTVEELALLLEAVSERWKPWLCLAAFAGLRTSEIFRLEWNAVKWNQGVIAIRRRVAKKVRVSRLVPIQPNLAAWLTSYREAHGMVVNAGNQKALEYQHHLELQRLQKATGLHWKRNALRHSFGSYRLAVLLDHARVALEMGNSVAKVRENYEDPKDEAEGRRYFALNPPADSEKILNLPLEFRR